MPVFRGDWPDHIKPGAKSSFANEYPSLPVEYTEFFTVETSKRAFEQFLFSTGLGTLATKPEGQTIAMDKPQPRGKVTLTHTTFGLGYEVTQEAWEDDLFGAIVPPSSRFLAAAERDGEEIVAASVFNLAFTTQQAYDGVALISTAHTGVGIPNMANRPAVDADIGVSSLQASLERFMLRTDDRGIRVKISPEKVVHHPNMFWLVREILGADKKPFTANNEPNIVGQQGLTPSTYTFLTDTDAWYVIGSKKFLKFFFLWRRKPAMDDDFNKKDQIASFFISSRFSVGSLDWRAIDGSIGA